MNARAGRFETLAGALAVIAWLIAVAIVESAGDRGEETPAELLAYFEDQELTIYIGAIVFFIGSALMIWFGGVLRTAIAVTGLERLASIAQGSAVALALASMGLIVPQLSAALSSAESDSESALTPEAAQALWSAGDGFIVASSVAAASLVACVGLATLRSRAFPGWFGWVSLVLALALVLPFVHWFAIFFLLPLWILLATWLLWRASGVPRATPEVTPAA